MSSVKLLQPEEVEEYNRAVAEAIEIYKVPPAPAMPVQQSFFDDPEGLVPSNGSHAMVVRERNHEDSEAQAGYASDTYFALVHTPVDISKAMKIPKARTALNKEWSKLQDQLKAWDLSSVCERSQVIERCTK